MKTPCYYKHANAIESGTLYNFKVMGFPSSIVGTHVIAEKDSPLVIMRGLSMVAVLPAGSTVIRGEPTEPEAKDAEIARLKTNLGALRARIDQIGMAAEDPPFFFKRRILKHITELVKAT